MYAYMVKKTPLKCSIIKGLYPCTNCIHPRDLIDPSIRGSYETNLCSKYIKGRKNAAQRP